MKHRLITLLIVWLALNSGAQALNEADIMQQLKHSLMTAETAADSVPILFNLFDIDPESSRNQYGFQLIETAHRSGNDDVALDAIRNLANYNMRSDTTLMNLFEITNRFPDSAERQHTVTFIRLMLNNARVRFADKEEKQRHFQELLKQSNLNPPTDIYDRIVLLHALCNYLSEISSGELLMSYVDRLGALVQNLPQSDYAIRNCYYVYAAMAYSAAGDSENAVKSDQTMLSVIHGLEERNKKIGRIYKNYDPNRYIIYTRLLENYKNLTPEQIEEYYQNCLDLVKKDVRSRATYSKAPLPSIYYHMAHGDYANALPLLVSGLDSAYIAPRKLQILRMTVDAARELGDDATLIKTYPQYAAVLEEYLQTRLQEKYRELQIVYDVSSIKNDNDRLLIENQKARVRQTKAIAIVCGVAALLMLVLVIMLWRTNRHRKVLAAHLEAVNHNLEKERDNLKAARDEIVAARDEAQRANQMKSDFINNMSHEITVPLQALTQYAYLVATSAEDSSDRYIRRFADLITYNSELVATIINDVLHISEMHNSTIQIETRSFNIKNICAVAVDTVSRKVNPGVNITFDSAEEEDIVIFSDSHRLLQILSNILVNAAKFTSEGSISLTFRKSESGKNVEFVITDTGIGVNPKYSEKIFERFVKLDSRTQGVGLGLTIARTIARKLGGDIVLDVSYSDGARFIVTLPINE